LRVQVLHDGFRDNFASYAGTVTFFGRGVGHARAD